MKAIPKDIILLIFALFFNKLKIRPQVPNPVKPFVSVLSPETIEKYKWSAKPKCKSLDYIAMVYLIIKIYNK